MRASPGNWKDCTMFMQDAANPKINITAEIPDSVITAFQKCCGQFKKIRETEKTSICFSMDLDIDGLRSSSKHVASDVPIIAEKPTTDDQQHRSVSVNAPISLPNDVFDLIEYEVSQFLHRSEHRINTEKQIIDIVSAHMKSFNASFDVHPHGSSTYGFGGSVDFNILIETGIDHDSMLTRSTERNCRNQFISHFVRKKWRRANGSCT